ncbi:hypothetical protein TanjilG_09899 [Lupinus angustifolius]|uniref:cytokinin dehydrogenase n=2 Tax=Lupinus angustifolius TaxID=3871 RepID=A0A1J7GVF4_LUPAN|nr:hypothetical protein TanjilG_09899 [Lupinus angustifolius]
MTQNNFILSKALAILCLASIVVITQGQITPSSPSPLSKNLATKLHNDPETLSQVSTDYGHIVHVNASAVFEPTSVYDIIELIKYSNSLAKPFTIAARGQAHSVDGQAMAQNGVVVNMTHLGDFRNGSGIIVSDKYADVGGEQIWIDVLHETLKRGLTPLSWTDYLYLSVGGTLSNAGIGGQTFIFGPQISNVLELDVITGKGDLITCSAGNNSEAFYAVLGGLGQYGVITRARIALGPAPSRVKWLRLLYTDFSAFSRDQEHLISLNDTEAADYVEGLILINKPPFDLSFFPASDQQRITTLVSKYGIVYTIELVKYYNPNSEAKVKEEVAILVKPLNFVPTFLFEKDVSYEEFLDRVHSDELVLRSKGLWEVPHPWINFFIPKSQILDFNEGVIKGIILKQNIIAEVFLLYPMKRNK